MKSIKLATVFSGIGSVEHALKQLNVKHKILFACDNGEREIEETYDEIMKYSKSMEFDNDALNNYVKSLYDRTKKKNYVKKTYMANYELDENNWFEDIRFIEGNRYKAENVDLFVGGSPCQSFSISGKRAGLNDARGTLFYDFARMVNELQPKVFIYENVPGLLNHDGGNTFNIITAIFESLGYNWTWAKLNAKDYGIPQNRYRVFVVGFRSDLNITNFSFPNPIDLTTTVVDYLENNPDHKYYLGEKGFRWCTSEKSLKKRVSINRPIARTEAANQQFNWCGDKVFIPIINAEWAYDEPRIYIGTFENEEGILRKLTPRECLRIMGYDDDFKIVVNDQQMYRQSGNSIVVNCMKSIIQSIIATGVYND